ncbi:tripartite ATP-independent transporter DctP family solute receptor [Algoriphagus boseongensis]|uniref:Tripartite ATP-independent transporter DctP family solute receptor n=1 Tax=Algoriphagus boseongensis TaxID=1442587 RepID=A0A4R6T8A1_9BACT|nr:TRAP transporter substrate-binding protein [Algoriphagus boseongensis]TDQ19220.1 tripartite ATP-independent transporter DctP family solute receptor [Algoriphagus boseongensis]
MTRIKSLVVALFLISFFIGCKSDSRVKIIKMGHAQVVSHPVHNAMVFLAKRLEEKSGGKIKVKVYPNQQLGTERELLELLQIGSLGMTKVSAASLEAFSPEISVFGIPFLFRDDEHIQQILYGEIGRELLLSCEKFWLRGLCFYDAGKRSFYTKDKPVEKPEDLIGLKVRVQESKMAINMIRAMGGSPTPVAYGELYTALQQGIVDAAENNPPSFYNSRHYEVCKYYSIDEHTAVPDVVLVSTKVWEELNEQEQQWLQEAADESAVYQAKLWKESVDESMREVQKAGVQISYPSKEPFAEGVKALYETIKAESPELRILIDRIQNTRE